MKSTFVLGPGVYDCGTNNVIMKPHVNIVGSGRNVTRITGSIGGTLISGADNTELRHLTVHHTGAAENAIGIQMLGTMRVADVKVINDGATNLGFTAGIFVKGGTATIDTVEVIAILRS